jgi:two-component system phosphate regulon sensor histidine kinase PhoR
MTVVAGYLRMLLKERAGPMSEQQRRLLEEAERSCSRLSALLSEVSELSGLEGGTASFNRRRIDLRAILRDSVAALPELPDRDVAVELVTGSGECTINGDAVRLKTALTSVIAALRRELVTSDHLLVHEHSRRHVGHDVSWIAVGDRERIDRLSRADGAALTTFDEWRGGVGLSLAVARRTITAHGGMIWSPVEESRAGAVIVLPQGDPRGPGISTETY